LLAEGVVVEKQQHLMAAEAVVVEAVLELVHPW